MHALRWISVVFLYCVTQAQASWVADPLQAILPPTLKELKRRAKPFPEIKIEQFAKEPAGFIVRNLVSQEEVKELLSVARQGKKIMENHSPVLGMIPLDKAPDLNATKVVQTVNRRMAALVGLPETNVEEGYFSVYNAGYELSNLHLDNHHSLFHPIRVASFVLFLHSEGPDLAGGQTVFPLAAGSKALPAELRKPALPEQTVQAWNKILADGIPFKDGDHPQRGRTCSPSHTAPNGGDPCPPTIQHAQNRCAWVGGAGAAVAAVAGDSSLFWGVDAEGAQTVRSIHGSCSVKEGNKIVLAKFVRASPRPFLQDESAFTKALNRVKGKSSKSDEL